MLLQRNSHGFVAGLSKSLLLHAFGAFETCMLTYSFRAAKHYFALHAESR
jgi:hypothetical protein